MSDLELIRSLWPVYFPQDSFHQADKRVDAVRSFQKLILTNGKTLVKTLKKAMKHSSIEIDMNTLESIFPFPDFVSTLRTQPQEVLGCLVRFLKSLLFLFLITSRGLRSVLYIIHQSMHPHRLN